MRKKRIRNTCPAVRYNFDTPLFSGIGWPRMDRDGLPYVSGKKWDKLWQAWKCRFSDTISQKITFELWNLKFKIWFKANIYQSQYQIPDHLTLFSHVHDQNSGSGGSGLDNEFSGESMSENRHFQACHNLSLFSRDIWPSIAEFYTFIHQKNLPPRT